MKQPSAERTPKPAPSASAERPKAPARPTKNVTRPAPGNAPDFAKRSDTDQQTSKKAPRKLRSVHQIPVTALPSDEHLDEVLDDALNDDNLTEELPIEAPEDPAVVSPSASPFSRSRRGLSSETSTENLYDFVKKRTGCTEDDVAMIFELGYESELGRAIGYEALKKLKSDYRRRLARENRTHYLTSFGYRGSEDVSTQTASGVMATYLHERKKLFLSTLMTLLFTVLLFFLCQPDILAVGLPWISDAPYFLFPLLSLAALLGASCFSFHKLRAGWISYFHLKPTPYSAISVLLSVTVVYDILSLFTTAPMMRVDLIVCGAMLVLSICDILRLSSEMRVFELLATDEEKTVLEPTMPRKKKLRQGKKLVKIINDDIDESFYRVHRATEITGFFRRFNDFSSMHPLFHILIGMTPALGLVCGFAVLLVTGDLSLALSAFMTAFIASAPISAVFSFLYPLCRANRQLAKYRCALIGEEAVTEYSRSKTVIFADTELCSAEKCTGISVRESADFREDLRLASALFAKIGGSLSSVGHSTATRTKGNSQVAFVRIADNGVEAVVENNRHMIAGSAEFLKRHDIRISKETPDRALRRGENVSIMYVAIDGVLKLSYEMEYRFSPEFEVMAAELAEIDTAVAIQSYDPNLNEGFLKIYREGGIPIRVIKPGRFESDSVSQISDTGAVALGDRQDILYPLYAAKGVQSSRKFGFFLQLWFTLGSTVAVTVLSLLGGNGIIEWLTPTLLGAYHLILIAITAAVSVSHINRFTLRIRRSSDNFAEN